MSKSGDHEQVEHAETDRGRKTKSVHAPEEARQGEIVLQGRKHRRIYFAGLLGAIILALVVALTLV